MKDDSEESVGISDRVEIISTEDEKIKAIGEILSADSSRAILKILFNDSLTANQISQKIDISLPLVIYHLKKMQESGIVKITNIEKNSKSHDMKFYTVDKLAIIILPAKMSEHAKKSKSFFNSFTRIHRLATLGGVSLAAWFSSQIIQKGESNVSQTSMSAITSEASEIARKAMPMQDTISAPIMQADPTVQILWSVVAVLGIIVAGLIIEVIISKRYSKSTRASS